MADGSMGPLKKSEPYSRRPLASGRETPVQPGEVGWIFWKFFEENGVSILRQRTDVGPEKPGRPRPTTLSKCAGRSQVVASARSILQHTRCDAPPSRRRGRWCVPGAARPTHLLQHRQGYCWALAGTSSFGSTWSSSSPHRITKPVSPDAKPSLAFRKASAIKGFRTSRP
jgi:hypothetical protein